MHSLWAETGPGADESAGLPWVRSWAYVLGDMARGRSDRGARGCVEAATAEMGRRLLHASGLLSFTNNEEREGVLLLLRKRIWALGALFFLPVRGDRDNEDDSRENRRVCTRCVRAARRKQETGVFVVRRIPLQTYVHNWTASGSGLGATTVA